MGPRAVLGFNGQTLLGCGTGSALARLTQDELAILGPQCCKARAAGMGDPASTPGAARPSVPWASPPSGRDRTGARNLVRSLLATSPHLRHSSGAPREDRGTVLERECSAQGSQAAAAARSPSGKGVWVCKSSVEPHPPATNFLLGSGFFGQRQGHKVLQGQRSAPASGPGTNLELCPW